jgi:hypothetical protein
VQPPARIANQLDEAGLDVHVYVFERGIHLALAALELARDLIQPRHDLLGVVVGDQLDRRQHARVRLATAHVLAQEVLVEVDAGIEGRRRLVHRRGKPRPPPAGLGSRLVLVLFAHEGRTLLGALLIRNGRENGGQ